ncbi:MAG: mechanosensitive ion channel family protein [Clostridiales bacterium]|nr:mechanosensitive ion channel family protein [Clostridiales bacterium]
MDWEGIWNDIKNFFTNNIWNIISFFAALVIGIIVIKIILNIAKRVLGKTKIEKVTQAFLHHIIKFCLYLILVLVLLSIMGISISGLLTTISALVLAIGMALQNIITNIANGIVIVTTGMFKKGDFISVIGVDGSIDDINFLFTTIMTTDNKKVTIPNSAILNNPVVNAGANPTRRVDFAFEVAYESDVEQVKKVILDVIHSNGKVMLEPKAPFCRLKTLEASSIKFVANCWVDSEDYWDVYYYVIENVFNEFKRNNISIPYNQLEVRERKDNVVMPVIKEPLQDRVEKERKGKKKVDLENADLLAVFNKKKKENKKDKSNK